VHLLTPLGIADALMESVLHWDCDYPTDPPANVDFVIVWHIACALIIRLICKTGVTFSVTL